MARLAKIGSALICLLLASCSLIGFAYNNAPDFVSGKIEDAFNLTDWQSDLLNHRLDRFFSWHRQHELEVYQLWLERAATATADGIDANEILELLASLDSAWRRAVEQAIDNLGNLANTLDPAQIEHYQRYYRETSQRYVSYLAMSAQQREIFRVKRDLKNLEKWFGKFDYFLEQRVTAELRQLPDLDEPWYRFRQARHQALVQALGATAAGGPTQQDLKRIMLDDTTAYARDFQSARKAYWQAYANTLAQISTWLSSAQRRHAANKLKYYAAIVAGLRPEK